MRKPNRLVWSATLLVTLLVSTLWIGGCGTNPVAPVTANDDLNALRDAEAQLDGQSIRPAGIVGTLLSDKDTALVGKSGGTIELLLGTATSTLDVPSGALTADVSITAAAVQLPTLYGDVTLYDFGPEGLTFGKPAVLTLSTNMPKSAVFSLYWYNTVTRRWEWQQDATVDSNGRVRFEIYHFSKYGIT